MDHGLDIEKRVRDGLLRLAKDLQIPLLATNDSHYVMQRGRAAHEHLLCVQSGSTMDSRPATPASGSSSRATATTSSPPAEMRALWVDKYDLREACDNTLLIAERCDVEFTEGNGTYMPRFPLPAGHTEETWLRRGGRARAGAPLPGRRPRRGRATGPTSRSASSSRWGSRATSWWSPTSSTGPRSSGIRVGPGRGSGAGSIVAYALRITDLDPLGARPAVRAVPQPRARSRCPTSTSTSTSVGAAR